MAAAAARAGEKFGGGMKEVLTLRAVGVKLLHLFFAVCFYLQTRRFNVAIGKKVVIFDHGVLKTESTAKSS